MVSCEWLKSPSGLIAFLEIYGLWLYIIIVKINVVNGTLINPLAAITSPHFTQETAT